MKQVQSADGTAIAYERTGSGPALVIVTGAFCDRGTGATLAAELVDYTVYRYDRRGAAIPVTHPRTRWSGKSRISARW